MNITVRTDGVMNNVLTEQEFINIVTQIFGDGKSIDEYIDLYNNAGPAKFGGITVHKEVTGEGHCA